METQSVAQDRNHVAIVAQAFAKQISVARPDGQMPQAQPHLLGYRLRLAG
jgi:hypothetical protein